MCVGGGLVVVNVCVCVKEWYIVLYNSRRIMTIYNTHRSVPCSTISRESFFCSIWKQIQRHTISKEMSRSNPSPQSSGKPTKRRQKECKPWRGMEGQHAWEMHRSAPDGFRTMKEEVSTFPHP